MNSSWWRRLDELDDEQKKFILLPTNGRHILEGPPGSGKTNLLLLRAQYIAGQGEKNVLVLTYTKELAGFIRTGISAKGLISSDQVRTFHSWAHEHILTYLGMRAIEKGAAFDDAARQRMAELIDKANEKAPSKNLFSAIFIDETQDLSTEELSSVLSLSENVCVCGDGRQGIYKQDGIDIGKKLGLTPHLLKKHYRIGHRIARVADRLMPPTDGMDSLETTSNYNPKTQGESSARMHDSPSREGQFITMLEILRVQLVAFKGDTIGIFCATKESLAELQARFTATDLSDFVAIHARDSVDGGFSSDRPIHVMTMHAAKGTEFRAVHLYGVEELKGFPLNSRHLGYTAVTRAKTALNAYRTGETNKPLESAFAEPAHMELSDLFPGGV